MLAPGHEEVAFADFEFATPSGRIELVSEEAQRRWGLNPLPTYTEPVESARGDAAETGPFPLPLLLPTAVIS